MQELCCDKHQEVQEGFVHFFPALLSHLPAAEQAALFELLMRHLSMGTASWRCRVGLAQQAGRLANMEVLLYCIAGIIHTTVAIEYPAGVVYS